MGPTKGKYENSCNNNKAPRHVKQKLRQAINNARWREKLLSSLELLEKLFYLLTWQTRQGELGETEACQRLGNEFTSSAVGWCKTVPASIPTYLYFYWGFICLLLSLDTIKRWNLRLRLRYFIFRKVYMHRWALLLRVFKI